MSGNLKKRDYDRSTIETERAIARANDVQDAINRSFTTTIDSIQSFEYTVVEVVGTGTNPVVVPVDGTEAILSGGDGNISDLWWQINGSNLEVTYLPDGVTARFLVF